MATALGPSLAKQSRRSVRSLSVQEKVHAIDRVHEGESKASVARDIGVPESTLRGWCKGEEKLRGIVARSSLGGNSSSNETSVDDSLEKTPKHGDAVTTTTRAATPTTNGIKRDFSMLEEALNQTSALKKFAKVVVAAAAMENNVKQPPDASISPLSDNHRKSPVSPINFSARSCENDSSSRSSFATNNSFAHHKDEAQMMGATATATTPPVPATTAAGTGSAASPATLPALAAIASAISSKNQFLYNAYTNGMLGDMVTKQEVMNNKPLDYSTKVSSRLPRPEVNEALMYWLQAQREQAALPMSPMEARTADTSSWFWKLYKNYGVLPQTVSAAHRANSSNGDHVSDEEDEPPATAADAVRHGEKFLRWLECCSDPSVTALQILQFRYLLNNVKDCAERRRQVRTKARSRRK